MKSTLKFWRDVEREDAVPGTALGGGAALADDDESADVQAFGRHCGGGDDLAAGEDWRAAELGLPVLLAARHGVHACLRCCRRATRRRPTAWRRWLLRAVAGAPAQVQTIYGICGERQMNEWTADWLPGYEHSKPVLIGNAAAEQFQLDVFGEVVAALAKTPMRLRTISGCRPPRC